MSDRETTLIELSGRLKLLVKDMWLKHGESSSCISPALEQVLMAVGSDGEANVSRLADTLHITSGAATQHLDALERLGALTRVINKEDRREVMVCLTRKGRSSLKRIKRVKLKLLEEAFQNFDDFELATFVGLLSKVNTTYINKERKHDA